MLRTDGPRRLFSSDIADLGPKRQSVQFGRDLATLDRCPADVTMAELFGAISVDQPLRPNGDNRQPPDGEQVRTVHVYRLPRWPRSPSGYTLRDSTCP